jgi:hypothetical protein
MNLLEQYSKINEQGREVFLKCLRKCGAVTIGPTKRGGIYLTIDDKQIFTDLSVNELKNARDVIDDFIKNVVGE